MQLAALAAVVSYFWADVRGLAGGAAQSLRTRSWSDPHLRLGLQIVIATIPIVIAGVLLSPVLNACRSPLRALPVVGAACLGLAVLLGLAEALARHRRTMEDGSFADALVVGIAQVGALIPGVSRSGATLTAALGLGFRRAEAARFSFLLGIPAILLAGLRELWALRSAGLDAHGWAVLVVGLTTASLSAFVAIWGLMRILERFSAWPFVIYRGLLGILILVGALAGWFH
jgi:undecaprenyl-diphosphatase